MRNFIAPLIGMIVLAVSFTSCSGGDAPTTNPAPAAAPTTLQGKLADQFYLGAAVGKSQIDRHDPAITELIKREFNTLTPENDLKWENIHPKRDSYNFVTSDRYVELAQEGDMHIVGHALVWHSQLGPYVLGITDSAELAAHITEHISTIVERYRGRIHAWDVVNEAFNEDGTLRESHFYNVLGENYLALAFNAAAAADPDAQLIYNDYNMWKPAKRAGVVRVIKRMLDAGVKVDGIGMQAHWGLNGPDLKEVENSIKAYSALGADVMFTELDVTVLPNPWDLEGADVNQDFSIFEGDVKMDPYRAGLPDSVQQQLADRYTDIFALFNRYQDNISRVTFWGVHDGHSWLNGWPISGRTNHPLLFDRKLKKKPAYDALMTETEVLN